MTAQVVTTVAGLKEKVGQRLGVSRWVEITQEHVDEFADATGDKQWIHVDPERAAKSPLGGTIAHGYFTLSLAPTLLWEILEVTDIKMAVNYGAEKIRFPAPLPVGSKARMSIDLKGIDEIPGGIQTHMVLTFEVEGGAKPVCVAETLYRFET